MRKVRIPDVGLIGLWAGVIAAVLVTVYMADTLISPECVTYEYLGHDPTMVEAMEMIAQPNVEHREQIVVNTLGQGVISRHDPVSNTITVDFEWLGLMEGESERMAVTVLHEMAHHHGMTADDGTVLGAMHTEPAPSLEVAQNEYNALTEGC